MEFSCRRHLVSMRVRLLLLQKSSRLGLFLVPVSTSVGVLASDSSVFHQIIDICFRLFIFVVEEFVVCSLAEKQFLRQH